MFLSPNSPPQVMFTTIKDLLAKTGVKPKEIGAQGARAEGAAGARLHQAVTWHSAALAMA